MSRMDAELLMDASSYLASTSHFRNVSSALSGRHGTRRATTKTADDYPSISPCVTRILFRRNCRYGCFFVAVLQKESRENTQSREMKMGCEKRLLDACCFFFM